MSVRRALRCHAADGSAADLLVVSPHTVNTHLDAQHFMAQRMAATEYLLDGSHAVVLSQPDVVVAMIREAAEQGTGRGDGYELRQPF
ncbi:hypothetical protein ABZV61_34985 [Streptomyces sp900116325]|uniref:Uncharacterized protein n=1 Tax=Streptomyces sp. 900116325 TaxID=3154295 RepID=A0ABV2UJ43_9ACTN